MPQELVKHDVKTTMKIAFGLNPRYAYISLMLHTLLFVLTLGIYPLVWFYRTTAYLNQKMQDYILNHPEETTPFSAPGKTLLKIVFIPLYPLYWIYKAAHCVAVLQDNEHVAEKLPWLCIVLSALSGVVVPVVILQNYINLLELGVKNQAGWTRSTNRSQYREPVAVFFASFGTLGIYNYIWVYHVTQFLNQVEGARKENPWKNALLCVLWPYQVFWVEKNATKLELLSESLNLKSVGFHVATLTTSIFGLLASAPIMQNQVNQIVNADYAAVHGALHSKYDTVVQNNLEYFHARFRDLDSYFNAVSWNWAAFFGGPLWFVFRKFKEMAVAATGFTCLDIVILHYALYSYSPVWLAVGLAISFIWHLLFGLYGNNTYRQHCLRVLKKEESVRARASGTAPLTTLLYAVALLFLIFVSFYQFRFQYKVLYDIPFDSVFNFIGGK